MADQQHTSILRRMAGRQGQDVGQNPLTSSRAVRIALTKVAQDSVGLNLTVGSIDEVVQPLDDMLAELSDDLMLVALRRGGNLAGLAAVDMQLRAAVVEMQTVRAVAEKPVESRAATRTDKRMCDPLLNGLIATLPHAVAGTEFEGWLDNASPGEMLQSVRSAGLVLDDHPYRVLRLQVTLAGGGREGMIALILPLLTQHIAPAAPVSDKIDWPMAFQATVCEAPLAFDAELCRFDMPIGQAENLSVGDLIPLEGCTVASVQLRALDGQAIRHARLGQSNGRRAIRIAPQELPDMEELTPLPGDALAASVSQALSSDDAHGSLVSDPLMANESALDEDSLGGSMQDEFEAIPSEGEEPDFPIAQVALADIDG